MKEIKDDRNRWRDTPCSWIGRINIVKIITLPFTTATKRIKYLGINLPRETKDLYAKNYDTDERN